jgi:ribonuclease HI
MRFGEHEKELVGSERGEHVTNNRMEITAALEALFACKNPVDMTIHSDSKYLGNCWHLWLPGWVRKGWVTAGKKPQPVANQDLWRAMLLASRVHTFRFVHVKGHNGDVLNERCDRLAGDARVKAMDAPSPDYESTGQAIVKRMLGVDLAVA